MTKFGRMEAFGAALPRIRDRTARDVRARGLPREKVLATVVELLDRTLVRVGNEEYARHNGSFGLTTLRDRHVTVEGAHLRFHFRGKSGKEHVVDVTDPRLAAIVKRCQELPGQELFHFREDGGSLHPVESADVNAYLREATGEHFTAKDFRTWHGTLLAACSLARIRDEGRATKRRVTRALAEVAARLGNTPAVCRKSYVHPAIVDRYLRGDLGTILDPRRPLPECEAALLLVLEEERGRKTPKARTIASHTEVGTRRPRAISPRRRASPRRR
jgi:DNA topoisomerase-1